MKKIFGFYYCLDELDRIQETSILLLSFGTGCSFFDDSVAEM